MDSDASRKLLYPGFVQSIGIIVTFLILSICAELLMAAITGNTHLLPIPYTAAIAIATAGTLAFAWFLSEAPAPEAFPRGEFSMGIVVSIFLVIAGIAVFLTEATDIVAQIFPIPADIQEQLRDLGNNPLFTFYAIAIGPALEELLMRGVVMRGLLSRYTPTMAILANAWLFAVMHFNPWQFIAAFTLGALNSWLFVRKRSIRLCIITHALWNGFFFMQDTISGDGPLKLSFAINVAAACLVVGGLRQLRKQL